MKIISEFNKNMENILFNIFKSQSQSLPLSEKLESPFYPQVGTSKTGFHTSTFISKNPCGFYYQNSFNIGDKK